MKRLYIIVEGQTKEDYDKVIEGNLIAFEIGLPRIMEKCPRFNAWIEKLITACNASE